MTMRIYLQFFIRLAVVASQECEVAQNSDKILTYSSSRSSKVIDLGRCQSKAHMQLPISHCNFGLCWPLVVFEISTHKSRK